MEGGRSKPRRAQHSEPLFDQRVAARYRPSLGPFWGIRCRSLSPSPLWANPVNWGIPPRTPKSPISPTLAF